MTHAEWRRLRPRSRRVGSVLTGPMFTFVVALAGLWLTWVPLAVVSGPRTPDVLAAVTSFSEGFAAQAAPVQAVLVGVLTAVFIVRVIDQNAGNRLDDAAGPWAVILVHIIAAVSLDAGVLGIIGVAADPSKVGQVWAFTAVSAVALTLAWAVDAGFTLRRKKQRRRTKAELRITSWGIHRRAAFLLGHRGVRRRPYLRVAFIMAATWLIATIAATGAFSVAWSEASPSFLLSVTVFSAPWALWCTLAASLWVAAIASPGQPAAVQIPAAATTGFLVASPLVVFLTLSHPQHVTGFRVAVLISALIPFVHIFMNPKRPLTLRHAFIAVELRRYRRRRLLLLKDLYVLRTRRKSPPARGRWPWRRPSPQQKPLKLLQQQRPSDGDGSYEWWVNVGKPPMYS
ncbi:hypothetical protein NY551_00440 [Curtobacterium flaccumfaciens pv. oortii]|uniref:hypothetical protein n=1 Tax=Curtobacterium flaccumfaciens TaxID=2035 RepID=UPI002657BD39|nr:hypothetical protein [Curtobacterium flaccumfaciens]MCS5521199.1 hypothetical protein [Curtobacterium flaccumfaciens pv. oortii]